MINGYKSQCSGIKKIEKETQYLLDQRFQLLLLVISNSAHSLKDKVKVYA